MELEAEYEAENNRNMIIVIGILFGIGGLFLLHAVIIACISCPVKDVHGKLVVPYAGSDDDNGGGETTPRMLRGPEAHESDADDEGWEQECPSRRVSKGKKCQTNRNKVSHDDKPRITS